MKKLLAIVISMAMLVAMMPVGVFAVDDNCVAEINGEHYQTLQAAVDAVKTGETITLVKSFSTEDQIEITDKQITLDLNGNSLTKINDENKKGSDLALIYVHSGSEGTAEGKVTIIDTKGEGKLISNYDNILYLNGGTIEQVSGTVESTGYWIYGEQAYGNVIVNVLGSETDVKNYSEFIMGKDAVISSLKTTTGYEHVGCGYVMVGPNGGKSAFGANMNISGRIENAVLYINGQIAKSTGNVPNFNVHNTAVVNGGIYAAGYAKWNIEGADITGATGIEIRAGELTVSDNAKITGTSVPTTVTPNGNGSTTDGAGIAIAQHNTKLPIDVKISSGDIKGFSALYESNPQGSSAENIAKVKIAVSGGNFTAINNGTMAIYSQDKDNFITGGTFSDVSALRYLAEEGDLDVNININNANSKFEAAGISIPEAKNSKRNITIDLNGSKWIGIKSLAGSTGTQNQVLQLLKGNNITIKNGTISIKEGQDGPEKSRFIIQNYSNLTLEDVTLDGTNLIESDGYTLSNNCGTVNIKGNTNIIATNNRTAFDVSWWPKAYSDGAIVNINTTGKISGNIEMGLYGEKGVNNEENKLVDTKSKINIIAGTFEGEFIKAPEYSMYPTGLTADEREAMYKKMLTITGGTFSSDPSAYVASGYYSAENSDGKYTVYRYIPSTPSTPADNVTNNTADKSTTADLTPAVKDNKAETTVDAKTADKIVDKAVANKSTEVIVDAAGNNTVASSEVAIPEKTVKELAEKTDANLVIKTDNGKVDLDKTAVKALADQAGTTGTVKLIVETVKNDADICHVNLKLVTSNGAVTDFKGGNVAVTINLTKELAAKDVVCVYINDNGIYTLVNGQKNADGTYTFTTGHFSEYAVMAKDEADKKIAEQLDTMIKDVNLKVRTSKTAKKNIKAVVSGDVKAITDAGYTVKYKFYRSEKKASKYVGKVTKTSKTYINTVGKKGTKYYYKAKALVYDGDKLVGQTVLTQCKYGVRTWSK